MRGHKRLGLGFVENGGGLECQKAPNVGLKTSFFFKSSPHVPVHISGVPVHFGYCPILRRVYRYTLVVY